MKPRILVIAGLGLAVIIMAVAVVLNLLPGQSASELAASSTTGSAPNVTSAPSSQLPPTRTPTISAGPPAAVSAAPVSKPPGSASINPKAPAATPDSTRPLEVGSPAQQSTASALPKSREDGPLINAPLPAEASANGKLVAGFPAKVIETVPSSALKSSSVSPQESILQVSLVAHSTAEPLAVMQFYQKRFAALGLGAAEAPAGTGSAAMWFTRGTDKITVTTTPSQGGGTEYSVFGILHAES